MTAEARLIFNKEEKEILEKARKILDTASEYMAKKDYPALQFRNYEKIGRGIIDDAIILLGYLTDIDEFPALIE